MRPVVSRLLIALATCVAATPAHALIPNGATAPEFTKTDLNSVSRSLSDYSGKVVVLFLLGYSCPFCLQNGPSVEADILQHYQSMNPGQVVVLGADLYTDTNPAKLQTFQDATGVTFPLLNYGSSSTGGNLDALYGPFDNFIVINKQGIVRYHAALTWPHGNRYHLNEIRGAVDSLVSSNAGVGPRTLGSLALAAAPNPSHGDVSIEFRAPADDAAAARVEVFGLDGRRIATLWNRPMPGSVLRVTWNARTDEGAKVAAGIYLIRAQRGGMRVLSRIALVP